jgi:sporulation protein YlmC with PRC-barrel domain
MIGSMIATLGMLFLLNSNGFAQVTKDEEGVKVKAGRVDVDVKRDDRAGAASTRTIDTAGLRASTVIGANVHNRSDEEVGSIKDLVIDPSSGRVRYAALSFGGFLGFGDKLFAIPWQAFECRRDKETADYRIVLNIDETTLKEAPGFDDARWPDFSDKRFTDEIDAFYRSRIRTDKVEVEVDRPARRDRD